jgi:hypothetical protein
MTPEPDRCWLQCIALVMASVGASQSIATAQAERPVVALPIERPLVAVWRVINTDVTIEPLDVSYLRVAVWEDGTVIFARDPTRWERKLLRGSISQAEIDQLKKELVDSGIFAVTETSYLVPDAPVDAIAVQIDNQKTTLSWDERENPHYGANIGNTPQYREFKKCWKAVNRIAIGACPKMARPIEGRIEPSISMRRSLPWADK